MELTEALKKANKGLKELSYLDGLTSVANRRYFDEQINAEWRSKKRRKTPLSLILIM
ncbi:MAG: GGDEF domain-containing protein [bacterium]|nr:GGDEF domain-containing protein [bacterium]